MKKFILLLLLLLIICFIPFNLYLEKFQPNYSFWDIVEIFNENFIKNNFSDKADDWGAFGDYIGGALSPILAFASFMALLYTIRLQSEELKATREELARSAKAQENSEKALAEQSQIFHQQQFESTFFTLLNEINVLVKDVKQSFDTEWISTASDFQNIKNYRQREFCIALNYFKSKHLEQECHYAYYIEYRDENFDLNQKEVNENIKQIQLWIDSQIDGFQKFSLLTYQILKLINQSSSDNKKQYANLLRTCIPFQLLQLLYINIYRPDTEYFQKYKKLLEKFAFLEHMPFSFYDGARYSTIGNGNRILFYLIDIYEESAFGDSEYIKQLNQYLKTKET